MISRSFPAKLFLLTTAFMVAVVPAVLARSSHSGMSMNNRPRIERPNNSGGVQRRPWRTMENRWLGRGQQRPNWRADRRSQPRQLTLQQPNTRALFYQPYWGDGGWGNGNWGKGTWGKGTWGNGARRNANRGDGTWRNGTWGNSGWRDGTWRNRAWHGNNRWADDRRFHHGERAFNLQEPNTRALFYQPYWPDGYWGNGPWSGGPRWFGNRPVRDANRAFNLQEPNTRALFYQPYWPGGYWNNWPWRGAPGWGDWAWQGGGNWPYGALETANVLEWNGAAYGNDDGYVTTVPSIGSYAGGISAYPQPGNGIYFTLQNNGYGPDGGGRQDGPPREQRTGARILTITAQNADAACSYEAGVCVIRP